MAVTACDDFPVRLASEWIAHPATSERNFYDRCLTPTLPLVSSRREALGKRG